MSVSKPPAGGNGDNKPTVKGVQAGTALPRAGQTAYRYKLHWHVLLIHFPISAFLGSYGFMILHLITQTPCYALASHVAMIAGAAVMIPTTVTGWTTWKNKFQGIRGKIFVRKIRIAYAMLAISIILVTYRSIYYTEILDPLHSVWHSFFFLAATLLFLGAVAEGYYGGRLNHK